MLTLLLAAHAAPQRFVQDEYLKLAREGKALDWHPNRWAAELVIHPDHLELALQDGPAEQCSYTSSPRADVMILTADCPSGPKQLAGGTGSRWRCCGET